MKRAGFSLLHILSLHLLALIITLLFRLYLFIDIDYQYPEPVSLITKATAFVKGIWFDNVIACYIMLLPLVIMWVAAYFKRIGRAVFYACSAFSATLFSIVFFISAANIPYFKYFFNNINSSIFNWAEYGSTTGGMITGETDYLIAIALSLSAIIGYWIAAFRFAKYFHKKAAAHSPMRYSLATLAGLTIGGSILAGLCVFGIRGRTGYNPIKVSQAYYCQDAFLNQVGISPTFNLLTSSLDDRRKENRPIELLPDDQAIANAQALLGREGIEGISPIARHIVATDSATKKNVVIILMESMSARLMSAFDQEKNLTPHLDSLYNNSRSYSNFYSSGLHTNHGIFATLYSYPTILFRNAMKGTTIPEYSGLPTVLADNGYHNMFFMTHESQYDNMNAYLRTNGFHEIHAEENYPSDKIVNSFGVQDDFLFGYALDRLNRVAEDNAPFFSVILTISNHPPYIIPQHFTPKSEETADQIVEYADWAIGQFMAEARKQPWWENTIFVLVGDHGKLVGTPMCVMPQSYNHVPLMIHGHGINPEIITDIAGQIDIGPTVLGMLNISYTQNNFGKDLNREQRDCIHYTSDKHIACRNSSHLYIFEPSNNLEYFYTVNDKNLSIAEADSTHLMLKNHCFSMLQSAQFMSQKHKTTDRAK